MNPSRPTLRADSAGGEKLTALGLGSPRLALGLATLGGAWGTVDEAESLATVRRALERGVRAFDLAPSYGIAEGLLGAALKDWRGDAPIISTKVGRLPARNAHEGNYDYSSAAMRRSLETSLQALGRSHVDLLFLHEPQLVPPTERPRVVATLRELQAAGLTRKLGIAGGHGEAWDGFLETGAFAVVMLFRRLDACILDGLSEDLPRLNRNGVALYQASPLHMGLLGARFDEFTRERPEWVWGPQIARAQRLQKLATTHDMALSTLAHRFAFGMAELDRVVIGAGNRAQLDAAWRDFEAGPLPRELFDAVCQINFS
ncbi:MAG: aldo/keto reductase [Opitutaceae bacterium]|nr:aldo/keto reductase [Cephaloticoccus sp.]MCP5529243.1 aldo/keto reductase [Opitutaceae bacterium]